MESKLNHLLANVTVEYHKLQNLHWYISGSDFFQVHAKLEELYDGLLPIVDDVAETILQQGGKPIASLGEVLSTASIKERDDAPVRSAQVFGLSLRTSRRFSKRSPLSRSLQTRRTTTW